ncbi:uncharacterized protein LOC130140458 [Syzygium oleosum]|uniref:uncharacterized protein LOC130140458 n=1 Tax=Syzygium oleosum TaxID=219896 RepID=UPI0024BBAB34|nr:uncharacterized protein LOC130140458 [Syzygium oleosum]
MMIGPGGMSSNGLALSMDTRIVCFGVPVDQDVEIVEYVAPEMDTTYTEYATTVWVDEGLPNLVPHRFKAWYVWFGEERWGPLRRFDGLPSAPGAISWDASGSNVPDDLVSDPESSPNYNPVEEP